MSLLDTKLEGNINVDAAKTLTTSTSSNASKGLEAAKQFAKGAIQKVTGKEVTPTRATTSDPWSGKAPTTFTRKEVRIDPHDQKKNALPKGAWTENDFNVYLDWYNWKKPANVLTTYTTKSLPRRTKLVTNALNKVRKEHGLPSKTADEFRTLLKTGHFPSIQVNVKTIPPKTDIREVVYREALPISRQDIPDFQSQVARQEMPDDIRNLTPETDLSKTSEKTWWDKFVEFLNKRWP